MHVSHLALGSRTVTGKEPGGAVDKHQLAAVTMINYIQTVWDSGDSIWTLNITQIIPVNIICCNRMRKLYGKIQSSDTVVFVVHV